MHKTRNVTYNIPAGDTIETDVISGFSGIHITDNPLLADQSSASDMLNLYLTQENTLATRPRVEYVKSSFADCKTMISVIKVSDNEIVYHYKNISDVIKLCVNSQEINLNNNDLDDTKIKAFKKDDKIYILSVKGYYVIKTDNKLYNVINDVDTYTPTTEIVDASGVSTVVDKTNLLNTRYKKLIHWTPYNDSTNTLKNAVDVKNYYYKIAKLWFSGKSYDFVKSLQDGRVVIRVLESSKTNTDDAVYSFYIADVLNGAVTTIPIIENTTCGNIGVSDDGNTYVYVSANRYLITKTLNDNTPIMHYNIPTSDNVDYFLQPSIVGASLEISHFFTVSPNGLYATYPIFVTENGNYYDMMLISKNNETYNTKKLISNLGYDQYICLSDDALYHIWLGYQLSIYNYTNSTDVISLKKRINIEDSEGENQPWVHYLKNQYYYKDNILGLYSYSKFFIYDIANDTLETKQNLLNAGHNPIYLNNMLYNTKESSLMVQSFKTGLVCKITDLDIDEYDCVNTGYNIWTKDKVYYYDASTEPLLTAIYSSNVTEPLIEDTPEDVLYRQFSIETDKQPLYIEYSIKYDSVNINNITELTDTSSTKYFSAGEYGTINVSVPKKKTSPNIYSSIIQLASTKPDLTLKDFDIQIKLIYSDIPMFTNYINFYNNYWLSYKNKLYNTQYNNPTYIPKDNESIVGDDTDITGFNIIGDSGMCVYKRNKQYLVTANQTDDIVLYYVNEMKTDKGNIPFGETILSAQNNYPLQFDDEGIYVLQIPENINTTENAAVLVSSRINNKYITEINKEYIITHNHLYWTYIMIPTYDTTKIYVWDSRNSGWYYWEIPIRVVGHWERLKTYDYVYDSNEETYGIYNHEEDWVSKPIRTINWDGSVNEYVITKDDIGEYQSKQYTETVFIDDKGDEYEFKVIDYIDPKNTSDLRTYFYDILINNNEKQIPWIWESQILPLTYSKYNKGYPAQNYMKQLTQTGFMFVDGDRTEDYSLNYSFTAYKKHMKDAKKDCLFGELNYIRSVLLRTRVPKFNFIKIKLTNTKNKRDKLNLISLKLKYKLMEERLS